NLIGAPGGNDSIWMDLGAPVLTMPDGRKYKALFAPLIVDLDNRVNLNIHGNVRGLDGNNNVIHVSNQGWGPWEVSLQQVLTKQPGGAGSAYEYTNLFTGATGPSRLGKYGVDQQPGTKGNVANPGSAPHFYNAVDYDGCQDNNTVSQPFQMPGGG